MTIRGREGGRRTGDASLDRRAAVTIRAMGRAGGGEEAVLHRLEQTADLRGLLQQGRVSRLVEIGQSPGDLQVRLGLVERIDGDYLNVVGLPVAALLRVWPGLLSLAS